MKNLKEYLLELELVKDNCYLDAYVKLVQDNEDTQGIKYETQKHHIIPKYYFVSRNLIVDNSINNIVTLLYKDHILAHYYLALCSYDERYFYSNMTFLNHSLSRKNKEKILDIESLLPLLTELQEKYKIQMQKMRKERHEKFLEKKARELEIWLSEKHTCEHCHKIMTEKYGTGKYCCKKCACTHPHTEETKKLLSELSKKGVCGMKGKSWSEESRQAHVKAINEYHKNHKYRHMTKEGIDIHVPIEEVDKYINDGFIIGETSKKGKSPWNKGLTKEDPRVAKYAEARNITMMKKYGTLDGNIFRKKKED